MGLQIDLYEMREAFQRFSQRPVKSSA